MNHVQSGLLTKQSAINAMSSNIAADSFPTFSTHTRRPRGEAKLGCPDFLSVLRICSHRRLERNRHCIERKMFAQLWDTRRFGCLIKKKEISAGQSRTWWEPNILFPKVSQSDASSTSRISALGRVFQISHYRQTLQWCRMVMMETGVKYSAWLKYGAPCYKIKIMLALFSWV